MSEDQPSDLCGIIACCSIGDYPNVWRVRYRTVVFKTGRPKSNPMKSF